MALCLLLQRWAAQNNAELLALTVDHGLRAEAAAEAQVTHETLTKRGLRHITLRWEGDKPASHIQERARAARYDLLLKTCRAEGFTHLALAHNLEDQAETFWMRLAHGSGLDGLAGMAAQRETEGVTLIRPLLGFTRAELRAVCTAKKTAWIEDVSNTNEKFLRVRLRKLEELLAAEGLSPQRMGNTMQKLAEARAALEQVTDNLMRAAVIFHDEGYATLQLPRLQNTPADISRRLLSCLLQSVAPQDYAPGFEALDKLAAALTAPGFSGSTLGGCEILGAEKNAVLVLREAAALPPSMPLEEGMIWDRRFMVLGYPAESLTIAPLNAAAIAHLRKHAAKDSAVLKRLEALPHKVRLTLPALFRDENLVAVPHLSWSAASAAADVSACRLVPRQNPPALNIV